MLNSVSTGAFIVPQLQCWFYTEDEMEAAPLGAAANIREENQWIVFLLAERVTVNVVFVLICFTSMHISNSIAKTYFKYFEHIINILNIKFLLDVIFGGRVQNRFCEPITIQYKIIIDCLFKNWRRLMLFIYNAHVVTTLVEVQHQCPWKVPEHTHSPAVT